MLGLAWTGRSRRAAFQETIEFLLGRRSQAVVTLVLGALYLIAVWVMPGQATGDGELPLPNPVGSTMLTAKPLEMANVGSVVVTDSRQDGSHREDRCHGPSR